MVASGSGAKLGRGLRSVSVLLRHQAESLLTRKPKHPVLSPSPTIIFACGSPVVLSGRLDDAYSPVRSGPRTNVSM